MKLKMFLNYYNNKIIIKQHCCYSNYLFIVCILIFLFSPSRYCWGQSKPYYSCHSRDATHNCHCRAEQFLKRCFQTNQVHPFPIFFLVQLQR